MLLDFEDPRDHDIAQVLVDRYDGVDRGNLPRQAVGDIMTFERAAEQGFEPATRNYHALG
jgi:hypothetical protein